MANQIMVIKPYRWENLWVFDDDRVGLDHEPFVGGADTIIDLAIARKGITNAEKGFLLLFSREPFPGGDMELNWIREEMGGNVYEWEGRKGWLCPALQLYFASPPLKMHVQLKSIHPQ